MGEPPSRADLSAALNRAIDTFMENDYDSEQHRQLSDLVGRFHAIARQGMVRSASNRRDRFITQMADVVDETAAGEAARFVPFLESPYSGTENPLAPSTSVRRDGGDVVARVHLGSALEGAPGRAHGGAVAAIFDDIMGAVQRVTGRPAYTKSLTVHYLAPFPADREVTITAREVECDDRAFTIEADAATGEGKVVARSTATFTRVEVGRFGLTPGK